MAPPPRRTIPADAASTLYELLPSQLGKDILLSLQTGGWELPQNQPRIPAAREPVGQASSFSPSITSNVQADELDQSVEFPRAAESPTQYSANDGIVGLEISDNPRPDITQSEGIVFSSSPLNEMMDPPVVLPSSPPIHLILPSVIPGEEADMFPRSESVSSSRAQDVDCSSPSSPLSQDQPLHDSDCLNNTNKCICSKCQDKFSPPRAPRPFRYAKQPGVGSGHGQKTKSYCIRSEVEIEDEMSSLNDDEEKDETYKPK